MKKLFTFIFASSILLFTSCVDKDFDLSKVNDDNIVIGDEFIIPMGNIKFKLEEFVNSSVITKAANMAMLPNNFEQTYEISTGLDQGVLDAITSSGSQSIKAYVINPTELAFRIKISFLENNEDSTPLVLVNHSINGSGTDGGKTEIRRDITKEDLEKAARSTMVKVEFSVTGINKPISITSDDNIEINIKIIRKGGIKL